MGGGVKKNKDKKSCWFCSASILIDCLFVYAFDIYYIWSFMHADNTVLVNACMYGLIAAVALHQGFVFHTVSDMAT